MRAVIGMIALLFLTFLCSERRGQIPSRTVTGGIFLQLLLAVVLLRFPPVRAVMLLINHGAFALQAATDDGAAFAFGYLGGAALPFVQSGPGSSLVLAFKILPLVLVISALSSLLLYWGVLQKITHALAWLLRRSLGVDGPLALGAAVHIFVGMIEAPLLVRAYLSKMQRGELFALMCCGMAGVAGTVMVIYASMLANVLPDALSTILAASVISTPAALAVAAIMVPFTAKNEGLPVIDPAHRPASSLDALARGTMDGVAPLVAIAAFLIVTIALVGLFNRFLGLFGGGLSLQAIFAWPLRPVMWLIGIPWGQSNVAAHLMGTKTVLNELVAYQNLAALPAGALDAKSRMILTCALCGFANFGSLGIMIGGMGAMVPERRGEVVNLGLRSILAGTIATCLSGAVAGMIG